MSKKYNIAMTGVFCGFLAAVLGLSIILPDKTFSELENRNLSTVPELSVESLTNGDFMADAEEYTADHNPPDPTRRSHSPVRCRSAFWG